MFSKYNNYESMAYRSFSGVSSNAIYNPVLNHFFLSRGVRKVTIGITGLWRPRVQIDVAFWSFDVGSSYPCLAEKTKRWIVHPLKGNVSWV